MNLSVRILLLQLFKLRIAFRVIFNEDNYIKWRLHFQSKSCRSRHSKHLRLSIVSIKQRQRWHDMCTLAGPSKSVDINKHEILIF